MKQVIQLLQDKNEFLKSFFTINETELEKFEKGNFRSLDSFYNMREKILNLIQKIDEQISNIEYELQNHKFTDDEKTEIKKVLSEKDSLVSDILDQDLRVISTIESEKTKIIEDLRKSQQSNKGLKAYSRSIAAIDWED